MHSDHEKYQLENNKHIKRSHQGNHQETNKQN